MTCTSTSAPTAHAFDPADWLSRFEACGGGYVLTENRMHLFVSLTGTTIDDQRHARQMLAVLTDAREQAIHDLLSGTPRREREPHQRMRARSSWRPAAPARLAPGMFAFVGRINRACREHGMRWSTFGRRAVRDPAFVADLFDGRVVRPATIAKVEGFIAQLGEVSR